ncbi:MAG: AAA-like domain-containing protein, partial [Anaerolineae bacterium]|nr:AAA-like domain-containing protein [Anaerolineae bacterium]
RETDTVHASVEKDKVPPPLPQTDPRILAVPGGAVKLRDPLYIRRNADADLENEILRSGTTTTIQAPRQTGKSSLLVRALHHARENDRKIVNLDMQTVGREEQASPNNFLLYLAKFIVRNLRLNLAEVDTAWQSSLGPQDKLTYLFEDYILPQCNTTIVLAIDEADRLLKTDYYQDFFSLLRSWHNKRALEEVWEKLNIVLVISTEPYLLIHEPHQSPFNVGLKIYLSDFDSKQISELNQRHGAPLQTNELAELMTLLNGHPYLTRQAMYLLSANKYTWPDLVNNPIDDHGPFGDHLWRNYLLLQDEYALQESLREVIQHQRCTDEFGFTRLLRAGLIKGNIDACNFRCDLYKMYFERKLA